MTFQEQLGLWLANRATTDAEFAKDYAKKNKSVKDCVKYVEAKNASKGDGRKEEEPRQRSMLHRRPHR